MKTSRLLTVTIIDKADSTQGKLIREINFRERNQGKFN